MLKIDRLAKRIAGTQPNLIFYAVLRTSVD